MPAMAPGPSSAIMAAMLSRLHTRQRRSTFRSLTISPSTSCDFSSNDFLSLSTSPSLHQSYIGALSSLAAGHSFRLGSTGSRLLDGNSVYAESLEHAIASFHHAPAALLFNSGFDANSGFFACVPQPGDVVLYDEYIHASVHEGMRLSRAGATVPFMHNSLEALEKLLRDLTVRDELVREGKRSVFIALESVYSMDGDLAPIKDLVGLVERILPAGNGLVVVDEAHSTGVYGDCGRGIVCELGLEDRVFARLHTFGKALACNGAAFLVSPTTREYLINYARPLIYATFLSHPSLVAIRVVYDFMEQGGTTTLAAYLRTLVLHFYTRLKSLSPYLFLANRDALLHIPSSIPQSPIFSLLTPHPRLLAKHCQAAGFMVRAILPPTVPPGTGRLRVCLHAGNTATEVDGLVSAIESWLKSMKDGHKEDKVGGRKKELELAKARL